MRYMKYVWVVLLLQCVFANAGLAETLMRDGVVVSYELGAEEPGKFSIEIQNDNRHAVEVILNIYAMLAGLCEWVEDLDALEPLLPAHSGFSRWFGRHIRNVL